MRTILDDEADGRMVVLPFDIYRRFAWNDDQALLDPAPRYFPGQVVTDDALEVTGGDGDGGEPDRGADRRGGGRPGGARATCSPRRTSGGCWSRRARRAPTWCPRSRVRSCTTAPELRLVDLGHPGEPRTASYAPLILGMDLVVLGGSLVACAMTLFRRAHGYTARRLDDNPVGGN